MSDIDKELARLEAQRRGDPLTPEEIARIRAQGRRWATERRIRHEEYDRAMGFPYWPRWVIPAFMLALVLASVALGVLIVLR